MTLTQFPIVVLFLKTSQIRGKKFFKSNGKLPISYRFLLRNHLHHHRRQQTLLLLQLQLFRLQKHRTHSTSIGLIKGSLTIFCRCSNGRLWVLVSMLETLYLSRLYRLMTIKISPFFNKSSKTEIVILPHLQ